MDAAYNTEQQTPFSPQGTEQRSSGEGSSEQWEASLQQGGEKPLMLSSGAETEGVAPDATPLNPSAKEWDPLTERPPEDDRCLFLTFSNGYPLTESQIVDFFTRKYGSCIEKVYVHWPVTWHIPALFGKVVFSTSVVPAVILGGETQAKFYVQGKPLWCKKYDPNRRGGDENN